MPNKFKTSEFFHDDAIPKIIESLKELSATYEKEIDRIKKKALELNKVNESVNVTTSEGREQVTQNAKEADKLAKVYQKLAEAQEGVNNELVQAQEDLKTVNRLRRLEAKQTLAAADSYDALSAEMSILKIRYKQLTSEQIKNTKEGRALTKRIGDINDTLKELDKNVGVHTRNVGNYTDAIADLPGVLGSAGRGVQGLSGQFKALLKNPIVLFIGLVTGAIITLFNAFRKSERGAVLMAKATGIINAGMSTLTKLVTSVVDGITDFANNPLQSIKSLGKAIVENITNRITGAITAIGFFGESLKSLVTGNFDEARDAVKNLGTALTQVATGLDAQQQKNFADALKETTKQVLNQANAFAQLETAKRDNIKANRELVKQSERLQTVEQLQKATADDTTKSFKEREEAAENSRKALEKRAAIEIRIARNNLQLINREIDLRKSAGENVEALLDQQLSSYRELAAAERDYTLAVRDSEKQRAELKQDRLERDLDILIDGFDNQKTINERLLNDEKLTLAERAKIYADTANLAVDSFQKQIETIEKFTDIQVDANDLIRTSDAVLLNQKIRSLGLSEIIEGRLLEIVRERRIAIQDLKEAEADLIKERNKANKAPDVLDIFDFGKAAENESVLRVKEIATKVVKEAQLTARELELKTDPSNSFLGRLFGLTGKEGETLDSALDSAKQSLNEYISAIQKAADARVAASDRAVAAAENEYNRQVELQAAGLAFNTQAANQELQQARERQRQALEDQRKAQRQQIVLDSVSQASNLFTAVSKVYKDLPFPLNLAASGLMITAFIAAKAKAIAATKQEFAEGDLTVLEGGSHRSGKDVFIGEQKGKKQYAEGGEARMILSKRATQKYMSNGMLPAIFQSLKAGQFEQQFIRANSMGKQMQEQVHFLGTTNNVDTRRMEGLLKKLVKQNEETEYTNGNLTVRKYKNWTTRTRAVS